MPWLYHHYVGHDNNRDWFMLTQKETRNLTRVLYHDWMPQVFVDEHQMGSAGPRIFIPPYADPIDPDVHPLIWREVNLIGAHMALRLEQRGKSGAISGYSFDGVLAGRHAQHRLVEEHHRHADRGRLGAPGDARAASSPPSSRAAARGSWTTSPRATTRTRGRAAGGGCATSWTTSASSPTPCWRWRPIAARISCAISWCAPGPRWPTPAPARRTTSPPASATGRPRGVWPG